VAYVTAPDLRTARSATWDVAYDYRVNRTWAFHAGVLDRRGSRELIVDPVQGPVASQLLLESTGRSSYREAEIGLHVTLGAGADLNATYVRSQAWTDLNAFSTSFGSVLAPVIGANAYAPANADAPNRLLVRGRLMPSRRWLLTGVLDWRSGLPYSTVNETLDFVGPRNGLRFPTYLRLDLGIEHRFTIFRHRPWIGVRAANALNSFLPTDVHTNVASPAYGSFYNSAYRQVRFSVRFER
jgi:hypothetical protein